MNEKDEDPLQDEPFAYSETKDGKVFILCEGRTVTTLKDKDAQRFLTRARNASPREGQLLMAKATKNFKRGNERLGKSRPM